MTACVNKKHSRRVAAAVSASLVGALTLGAAPAVVMAQEAGVEQQFVTATDAWKDADIVATFNSGMPNYVSDPNTENVPHRTYKENVPVALDEATITFYPFGAQQPVVLKVDATNYTDEYDVAYYERDEKDGMPVGNPITKDISEVGEYVAVITATDGHYKGAKAYVRFDIDPIEFQAIKVVGSPVTYNGEKHDFDFEFKIDGKWVTLDRDVDYTVKYVPVRTDGTDESATDVVDAGNYRAVIEGIDAYANSAKLSPNIKVNQLDLSAVTVEGVISDDSHNPNDPAAIWIGGQRFGADSNIMKEVKAVIKNGPDTKPGNKTWFENGEYTFKLQAEDADDANFVKNSTQDFNSYKVGKLIDDAMYDGAAWPEEYVSYTDDSSTKWSSEKVTAVTGYPQQSLSYTDGDIQKYVVVGSNGTVYNSNAAEVTPGDWSGTVGTYGLTYRTSPTWMADNKYEFGGQWSTTLHVYKNKLDADASVQVAFNVDDDADLEIVTSINAVYDGKDFIQRIEVGARTPAGTPLTEGPDFTVTYYNADGAKVSKIVDAGTYTMKVTSSKYELSGTTEMTITVAPRIYGSAQAYIQKPLKFDDTSNHGYYIPWEADGVTITELDLRYDTGVKAAVYPDPANDGKGWDAIPMDVYKVTIVNEDGEEVKKITDEGVYTVKFENRNADAQNNYGKIADITVTCIKDGKELDEDGNWVLSHTLFSDVTYRDYFADPVAWVNFKKFMTGYDKTRVFGAYDSLTRGQVACVLYNMAVAHNKVDDSSLAYNELFGYDTGFSDVNGKAYYAKAIAWAAQAGVVNGYQDGTFHADQAVTRQEFACMLANYAKAYGTYEAAGSDALDEMSDADQVADFAKDSVAWAVENGIIGNSGYVAAGSTIIRADAACMVYNYAK